jgi:hypothetical protein
MRVATVEIGPGIDDADHRLALKILARIAHLLGAVGFVIAGLARCRKPALATQIGNGHGLLLFGHCFAFRADAYA